MNIPLRFPGDDGLAWVNSVRTYCVHYTLDHRDIHGGSAEHVRRRQDEMVVRAVMGTVLRETATRNVRATARGEETTIFFSLVMPDRGRNWFAEQTERERVEGRREGLDLAIDELLRMQSALKHEGTCTHVLHAQLGDAARALRRIQSEQTTAREAAPPIARPWSGEEG